MSWSGATNCPRSPGGCWKRKLNPARRDAGGISFLDGKGVHHVVRVYSSHMQCFSLIRRTLELLRFKHKSSSMLRSTCSHRQSHEQVVGVREELVEDWRASEEIRLFKKFGKGVILCVICQTTKLTKNL